MEEAMLECKASAVVHEVMEDGITDFTTLENPLAHDRYLVLALRACRCLGTKDASLIEIITCF